MYKVEIITNYPNILMIDDEKNQININELNHEINKELVKRGDLPENDKVTRRSFRIDESRREIILHAHGSFSDNIIVEFLTKLFKKENIVYTIRDISEQERVLYSTFFPEFHILGGQCFGGGAPNKTSRSIDGDSLSDSTTIDKHVDRLCESLNAIPGIETFASCNGHRGARPYYVCYTADTIESAETVVFYLTNIVDKLFTQLSINVNLVKTVIKAQYMPFGIPTGMYFLFEIVYDETETKKIYDFGDRASEIILEQVQRKNFGVRNPETRYLNFKKI